MGNTTLMALSALMGLVSSSGHPPTLSSGARSEASTPVRVPSLDGSFRTRSLLRAATRRAGTPPRAQPPALCARCVPPRHAHRGERAAQRPPLSLGCAYRLRRGVLATGHCRDRASRAAPARRRAAGALCARQAMSRPASLRLLYEDVHDRMHARHASVQRGGRGTHSAHHGLARWISGSGSRSPESRPDPDPDSDIVRILYICILFSHR